MCHADTVKQPRAVFRVPFGRTLCVVSVLLAVSGLAGLFVSGDVPGLIRAIPLAGAVCLALWMALWHPRVDVGDDRVIVVNVVRTWTIPFEALVDVSVRLAVTLETEAGSVTLWSATAPGRHEALRLTRADFRVRHGDASNTSPRPGDAITTESGATAVTIVRRWQAWNDAAPTNVSRKVTRTWHTLPTATLVALITASAVAPYVVS